jgi:predicted transcriptional regulator
MLTKAQVLKSIESLPNEFSIDEVIEKLLFLSDLDRRLKESEQGQLIDHEEVEKELLSNEEQ